MGSDENFIQQATRMDKRAEINMTPAMIRALDRVASGRHLSRADIIRQSMMAGLPLAFPEYADIYKQEVANV